MASRDRYSGVPVDVRSYGQHASAAAVAAVVAGGDYGCRRGYGHGVAAGSGAGDADSGDGGDGGN